MTFLSLFSGIGGIDLGLERAGMKCIGQVEIDPYCRAVLAKHWPDVWRHDDVKALCRRIGDCDPENEDGEGICPIHKTEFGECPCVGTDQFTDDVGWPDLIAGGDPCQQHANARTHGREPESLGGEFIRIVEEIRPHFVLRENPAAIRADAAWTAGRFAAALSNLGYASVVFPVRACCVGADHKRQRLFVFAHLQNADGARLEGDECEVLAGAIKGRQDADAARSDRRNAAPRICRGVDGIPNRVDRLRGLGNSVSPQVAEWIGRRIIEAGEGGGMTRPGHARARGARAAGK